MIYNNYYINFSILNPSKNLNKQQLIDFYANKYGVDANLMRAVINCESRNVETAIGDGGKSYGLVQIHLPSWPEITKEQAINPDFALDFMAKKFSENRENLWTCYTLLKFIISIFIFTRIS